MNNTQNTLRINPALINFKRPSPHSKYSPSAVDQWMNCGARTRLVQGIPEERNEYSDEGTLAHSVCEATFRQAWYGIPFSLELTMELASWERTHPGATAEMTECAQGYLDVLSYWLNETDKIGEVLWFGLEKGVPVFPEQGCFGTGDCIIVGTKGCAVIDYKHGKGKNVSAQTLQIKVYMAGIHRHLSGIPEGYGFHAVVYQPRTDVYAKEWCYTSDELAQFTTEIWTAIQRSEDPGMEPIEGSHCFWCPAKRTRDPALKCPVWGQKPIQLANENFGKFLEDMNAPVKSLRDANPKRDEAALKIIALLPLMTSIAKDMEEEFTMRLERGETIPGVSIVESPGKRQLVGETPEETAELLKKKFPKVNPWKIIPEQKKLMTLTELEKIKDIGKKGLSDLTVRPLKKKLHIMDNKMRSVLGQMANYGNMLLNNGEGQEDT